MHGLEKTQSGKTIIVVLSKTNARWYAEETPALDLDLLAVHQWDHLKS